MSEISENRIFDASTLNKVENAGFEKAQGILEFARILALLCECAPFDGCRERLKRLVPSTSYDNVGLMLSQTTEAKKLLLLKGMPSFCGISDIEPIVYRAGKGATLGCAELLSIAAVLRATSNLISYFEKCDMEAGEKLCAIAGELRANRFLEEKISTSILSEELVADNASSELYDIRRKIRNASNRVRENLNKFISGSESSKYLQENIVTTRNGRFVIPVKSEYRSMVNGLVHDTSASGATLFIEPISVVEANNEIRMLESKEKAEIEKILSELTDECRRFSDDLLKNYSILCSLGVIFTKAELSYRLGCEEPKLNDKGRVELIRARHPLLDKSKKTVPIDVSIGTGYKMIIVTGPNTGGKTVTLKTVGLFAYMAQCGLHIPCEAGSTLPVFDKILADIGDEQSIEQSLSTFSAHMVNIVDIISRMTPDSLVLLDELGAGTDPVEGAALAQAILETVRKTGCICCATTHYAELKTYALKTEGVTNASCEFDIDTLSPTYKLTIGLPGRSNAFAIAQRLGIPQSVIDNAKSNVDSDSSRFESVIAELEEKRQKLESEREKAERYRRELEEMHRTTKEQTDKLNERIDKEMKNAQRQARNLINSARASADYVFDELDKVKKQKDKEDFAKSLSNAKKNINDTFKKTDTTVNVERVEEEYTLPRDLVAGDIVMIRGINKKGTVTSVDGDNITVMAGVIKTKVNVNKLILLDEKATVERKPTANKTPRVSESLKAELDVRGYTGDDAWFMVDKYIDEAIYANLSQVTIIHGKGTGALRTALWGYLKHDKRVESMRSGAYGEGDYGVTVLKLK